MSFFETGQQLFLCKNIAVNLLWLDSCLFGHFSVAIVDNWSKMYAISKRVRDLAKLF